jgi:hypothetical protein
LVEGGEQVGEQQQQGVEHGKAGGTGVGS